MKMLIETTNLTYFYRSGTKDEVKALDNVDMTVYQGEILAITGQNGSGKSTLARHFNALLFPGKGKVAVKGLSTSNKQNIPVIRKIIGMVFQNPDNQLVTSLVEEDVAFGPENLGLPQPEIVKRVDWALHTLGLEDLRRENPHNLSEGQKQQVAIAGVLAMKPECIVLDEPTAHLDPRGRREVLESIVRLNREENITIVLLTHFMNEVIHCDRMIVMENGSVKMTGSPCDLFLKGEDLKKRGLDLPVASQIAEGLRRDGFSIKPGIIHMEDLIDCLCQLKL